MSFIMFLVVGLSVGVVLHGIAMDRVRLGLPGALLIGTLATFIGGFIGAAVAGQPVSAIGTSTVGGSAIGGYVSVALMAVFAHRRHILPHLRRRHPRPVHEPHHVGAPLGNDFR